MADWNKTKFTQAPKERLANARQEYSNVANQRLQAIAQGGSASPLASPWLSLQQAYQEYMQLQPAERALVGAGDARLLASPQSDAREARWQEAVEAAKAGRFQEFKP